MITLIMWLIMHTHVSTSGGWQGAYIQPTSSTCVGYDASEPGWFGNVAGFTGGDCS